MDPNEALRSILSGHLIADHVEALREWLARGGFEPAVPMPADCHEAFGAWPRYPATITATQWGVWCNSSETQEPSMRWEDVLKLKDSEY